MADTFPAFIASLAQLQKTIQDGSAAALLAHVKDVGEAANAPGVVPYDTGALHDSQFIEGPLTGAGRSTVRIGYDVEYATQVHEEPESARRTGMRKWLEVTLVQKAPDMGDRLKEKIG